MNSTPSRFLAPRARQSTGSPTLALSDRVRQLRGQGVEIIDLGAGDPTLDTPEHIRRAAAGSIERGETHYTDSAGLIELRRAIAAKLESENGVHCDPGDGVLVTGGGKAALFEAAQAVFGPGVEVLILEPAYVSFRPIVEIAGGSAVAVPLAADAGFRLTREALQEAATNATRGLIVNSPCNPTGRVLDEGELKVLTDFALERDLVVFSDEVYEKLVWDGRQHRSLASFPGMAERTLTFNSFSKTYCMTGWRLGYVAGPASIIAGVRRIHSHSATCIAPFVQRAGIAALEGSQQIISDARVLFDRTRRLLVEGLEAVRGFSCAMPEGAFYALADGRETGLSSLELAERLLVEAGVAATPGSAFGAAAEGHVRFTFGVPEERIRTAVEKIGRAFGWKGEPARAPGAGGIAGK